MCYRWRRGVEEISTSGSVLGAQSAGLLSFLSWPILGSHSQNLTLGKCLYLIMFRDLDDSEVPSQVAGQSVDDPLHAVFQQRIDAERQKKADSGNTQNWQRWMADPVEDQARTDAAKAKRDS